MNFKSIRTALYWAVPILFCLLLYWRGLSVWFHDDDFAFLGLYPYIHNWRDLASAIFQPTEHGTWRPLSERAYFIGVQWLFGVPHARPFRIIAFLTQFANLILIGAITLRLTQSRIAGFAAPILWIANSALVTVMAWDCAFMYALAGLVLLSAFWLLLRYIETGNSRYYAGMFAVFLLGFLVIETNLVFPALATAYTLLRARTYFRKTLPLFIPSILFVIAHEVFIPKQAGGPYSVHIDLGMFNSFRQYWSIALTPLAAAIFPRFPEKAATAGMIVFTVVLVGFVAYQAFRRNLLPVFFLSWFAIVLSPVLPFQEHITDYYLTLPLIGMAMLAAYAFAKAFRYRVWSGIVGGVLIAFFLLESVPSARGATRWNYDRSHDVKRLVMGAADLSRQNPGKIILLDGISDEMYWAAVSQSPFRFLSVENVYLTPGSYSCVVPAPQASEAEKFFPPVDKAQEAMANHTLLVYRFEQDHLVNVTTEYALPPAEAVNVADPKRANQLGPTWQPSEGGFRWMLKSASVTMDGPAYGCHKLYVTGYCPGSQLARGPFHLSVFLNGEPFPAVTVDKGNAQFRFEFPVKAAPGGHYEIVLELDHTVATPPDTRQLGLVFGTFEIR